jgi:hypothetical protein
VWPGAVSRGEIEVVELAHHRDVAHEFPELKMRIDAFKPRAVTHTVRNLHTATTRWLYGYD